MTTTLSQTARQKTDAQLSDYIHTFEEAAQSAHDELDYRRKHPNVGVPFTYWGFDRNVAPALPGEFVLNVARPGHMKTGIYTILANERDKHLREMEEDRHIIYVTAETTIENLMNNFIANETGLTLTDIAWGDLGDEQWQQIDGYTLRKSHRNIWFYGNSSTLARSRYIPPAEMKPATIANAVDCVANWNKGKLNVIDMVLVDYFQLLEPDRYDQEVRVRYENIMRSMKRIAITLPGPLFMACQAKQEVDKRDDPLPVQNDIEQTNEGHKDADIIFGQIRPALYKEKLKVGSTYHEVMMTDDIYQKLFLISLRKHKKAAAPNDHWLFIEPATNRITHKNPISFKQL